MIFKDERHINETVDEIIGQIIKLFHNIEKKKRLVFNYGEIMNVKTNEKTSKNF